MVYPNHSSVSVCVSPNSSSDLTITKIRGAKFLHGNEPTERREDALASLQYQKYCEWRNRPTVSPCGLVISRGRTHWILTDYSPVSPVAL